VTDKVTKTNLHHNYVGNCPIAKVYLKYTSHKWTSPSNFATDGRSVSL